MKYGSSPRAAISIGAASRGLALLRGKPNVGFDEVRRVAAPAMAHRLVLDYAAKLEGWDGRRVVAALLAQFPRSSEDCRRRWKRGNVSTPGATRRAPVAVGASPSLAASPRPRPSVGRLPDRSRSNRLRITIDSEWASTNGAGLPAGSLRYHQPRRSA